MKKKNEITMIRLILSFLIILMMIFPFYDLGIKFPVYIYNGNILIDLKYIIVGVLFVTACIFYYFDIYVKKNKNDTNYNELLNIIANRVLFNPVLIILGCNGMINTINAVVIIICDIIIAALINIDLRENHLLKENAIEKTKDILLTIGISLTLFYNIPFELVNLSVSDFVLVVATILSVVSAVKHYVFTKKYLK